MANKGHLTLSGLKHIFSLKSVLNLGLSDNLKFIFNDLPPVVLPVYKLSSSPLQSFWVSGFVTGEGSFFCFSKFQKSSLPCFFYWSSFTRQIIIVENSRIFWVC